MARSTPRQLFVNHQRSFRTAAADRRVIDAEWRAKTVPQRKALAKVLQRLADADRSVQNHKAANGKLEGDAEEIVDILENPAQDIPKLKKLINGVREPYEHLGVLLTELCKAWTAVAATEQRQARGFNDTSYQHAIAEARSALEEANEIADRVGRFNEESDLIQNNRKTLPKNSNGVEVMPAKWLAGDTVDWQAQEAERGELLVESLGKVDSEGCTWVPWFKTGDRQKGIEGWLWLAFDPNTNEVTNRIYRKTCSMGESLWRTASMFDGDARQPAERVPWEIACHDALMDVADLTSVVRLRERFTPSGNLIDDELTMYKLYMDWCPCGDTSDIIEKHRASDNRIPEAFIWYVAESLADAAVAMERGTLDENGPPAKDWRPIVHRDVKPCNVFLGLPGEAYPKYPKPVLADLGHGFRTSADDPNNPRWYNFSAGTPGYKAPELTRMVNRVTYEPVNRWRLSGKTDIYSIGATLHSLLALDIMPQQPIWLGDGLPETSLHTMKLPTEASDAADSTNSEEADSEEEDSEEEDSEEEDSEEEDSEEEPTWDKHFRSYSNELRQLVMDCLSYKPQDRPDALSLQQRIARITKSGSEAGSGTEASRDSGVDGEDEEAANDVFENVRLIREGRASPEMMETMGLQYPEDTYKLGLTREVLPARSHVG